MDAHKQPQLLLQWHDESALVDPNSQGALLGCADDVNIRVQRTFTSRHHAVVERGTNGFVLRDDSTNGTFVQTEDRQVAFVHRNSLRLWGSGWISLGEPLADDAAIHYRHV